MGKSYATPLPRSIKVLLTRPVRTLRTHDLDLLRRLLVRGTIAPREIKLNLDPTALAKALQIPVAQLSPDLLVPHAPLRVRRRGVEAKLVIGTPAPDADPVFLRTLAAARRWAAALQTRTCISEVARNAGHHDAFIRTRGALAFLSPKIQTAIRDGTLPAELTLHRMMRHPIPLDWQEQERMYGF